MGTSATRLSQPDRSSVFQEQFSHYEYELAETEPQKEEVYRLRYKRYRAEQLIGQRSDRRIHDTYDDAPNGRSYLIKRDGVSVATFRIHVCTSPEDKIPSRTGFDDIIDPLIDQGKTFIDPGRFVVDQEAARRHPELMHFTIRLAPMAAVWHGVDIGLGCVQQRHRAYYKRYFGFSLLCEPRPYEGLLVSGCLMGGPIAELEKRYFERFPHMHLRPGEGQALFGNPIGKIKPLENPISHKLPAIVAQEAAEKRVALSSA